METPTHAEILHLESWFASREVPKVVKINKAITQTNAPKYIEDNFKVLRIEDVTDFARKTTYAGLIELKEALMKEE